jgi:hypothetical protein
MARFDPDANQKQYQSETSNKGCYLRFFAHNGAKDVTYFSWNMKLEDIIKEQESHFKVFHNKPLKVVRIEDYLTGKTIWEKK